MGEVEYRVALAAGFVMLALAGLRYRIQADNGEPLDRRQEGWFILIGLRLTALLALLTLLAFVVAPQTLNWSRMHLPDIVRWIGFGLAASSACLKLWTFHTLGKNLTDTVVTRQSHSLVTTGPYRWVRHPFYTSFALDVIGVALLTDRWLLLLLGAIAFALIAARTRREEANLLERFGERYAQYRAEVGSYLPGVGRVRP